MSGSSSFWLALGAGLALLGGTFLEARAASRLRREGVRTGGTVIDNVKEPSESRKWWVPVIAFTDTEGHRVEFAPRVRTGRRRPVGHAVRVIYHRDRPDAARLYSWLDMWFTSALLLATGTGLIAVSVVMATQLAAEGGM